MEAQSVYQSVITSLFNLIKDEKLRTNVLFDLDLRKKVIANINNLLALEIDYQASFKDEKYSAAFAKAVVNITKEKIKFEKPDQKAIIDCYADYSDMITFCLNLYGISKETLSNTSIEITTKEISLNSKVSEEMKKKYGETTSNSETKKTIDGKEIEIVGATSDKPNFNGDYNKSFNQKGFNQMGEGFPLPPLNDQKFFPFKTKLKNAYWFKVALASFYSFSGLTYLILVILLNTNSFNLPKSASSIANSTFSKLYGENVETLSLAKSLLFGISYSQNISFYLLAFNFLLLFYISYIMIKPPATYKEQFWIPWLNIFFAGVFIFVNLITLYLGNVISVIAGNVSYFDNFAAAIKNTAAKNNISGISDEDIRRVYDELIAPNLKDNELKAITALLWLNFIILMLSIVYIVVLVILNPKYDREKILYANQEYQKLMSEMMQGRTYEMDRSIYEPEINVQEFINKKNERKNKNKEDNEKDN
ncbi:hypothetical protein SGLAD_v1c05180 [Spiroplasma gladiatoris]|uniref:Transmembrane protein n=1 Tax=Spiroplasma gladiatoris TaxID=2143 RepID=A0A4P7AHM4_9MOLU|nr:hypothetical protein [Spiroplasma gladiatoris]QBQ07717.1 hypothetical protein SGLAD_v1c05180 [Spiroplasma gladiatoris]